MTFRPHCFKCRCVFDLVPMLPIQPQRCTVCGYLPLHYQEITTVNFRERADQLRTDLQAAIVPILEQFQKDTGIMPTVQTFNLDVSSHGQPNHFLPSTIRLECKL